LVHFFGKPPPLTKVKNHKFKIIGNLRKT
jgi:hypothetical protein